MKFFLGRVLVELVTKMQEMTMDKTELGCLRAIVLFNPDVKGLKEISRYSLCSFLIFSLVLLLLFYCFNICILTSSNSVLLFLFHLRQLYHVLSTTRVEQLRERVYASLEEYTRSVLI